VCSIGTTPSGPVPGGDVVLRATTLRDGGEGAGLDGFFKKIIRILCANCKNRNVISVFLLTIDVNYNSIVESE
jgi:hypothetical protein